MTVKRILVVEDRPLYFGNIMMFAEMERPDDIFTNVATIKEAKELLSGGFNMVIVDGELPDGDGVDFIKYLREEAKFEGTIVFHPSDIGAWGERHWEAGADDVLTKPFGMDDITRIFQLLES